MKKNLRNYGLLVLFFISFAFMVSCKNHKHSVDKWSYDKDNHWQECSCNEKINLGSHDYEEWVILQSPTEDMGGLRSRKCKVCGYEEQENLPFHIHNYTPWKVLKEPTYEEEGKIERVCLDDETHINTMYLPTLNTEDYNFNVIEESTCTTEGLGLYTFVLIDQRLEFYQVLPLGEHNYEEKWDWDEDNHWHNALCEHKDVKGSLGSHQYSPWEIVEHETLKEPGLKKRICGECGYEQFEEIPPLDHEHQYLSWEIVEKPTLTSLGVIKRVCSKDETHIEYDTLPSLSSTEYTQEQVVAPTCGSFGSMRYTCTKHNQKFDIFVDIPKLPHPFSEDWEADETVHYHKALCEHTEERGGAEPHQFVRNVCTVCGYIKETSNLEYDLNLEGLGYTVLGIGTAKDVDIVIPNFYRGVPVIAIGENAFKNCSTIESVRFLNQIQTIGKSAFSGCDQLKQVIFSNQIKKIEDSAFENCRDLEQIILPQELEELGTSVFSNCRNLSQISIPNDLSVMGDYVFSGCYNLSYNEYDHAFYIGNEENPYLVLILAKDTNIETCIIHTTTKFIMDSAFNECVRLKEILIPGQVKSVGCNAFFMCTNLVSVQIGTSVIRIGQSAFGECINLESVLLSGKTLQIEEQAFFNCRKLTSLFFEGEELDWAGIQISDYNENFTTANLYFYSDVFKNGTYWHYDTNGKTPIPW